MELFRYIKKGQTIKTSLEIFERIVKSDDMKKRAQKEYYKKVDPVDTIDDVFQQVYTRFDGSVGQLENYANRTMSKINKSKYEFEIANSEAIERKLDKAQYGDVRLVGELPSTRRSKYEMITDKVIPSTDVKDCMTDIEDHYLQNVEYFATKDIKTARRIPDHILIDYDLDTIRSAIDCLYLMHKEEIDSFLELKPLAKLRPMTPELLKLTYETTVTHEAEVNGMQIVSRKQGYHAKNLYSVDLDKLIKLVMRTFYASQKGTIQGSKHSYYLTLSGMIATSKEELEGIVEAELVYELASKTRLHVISYQPHKKVIFGTTRPTTEPFEIVLFGRKLPIYLKKEALKENLQSSSPYLGRSAV